MLGSKLSYWNFCLSRFSSLIYSVTSILRKSIKLSIHFIQLNVQIKCHIRCNLDPWQKEQRNVYQILSKASLLKITFLFIFLFYIKSQGHFFLRSHLGFILRRLLLPRAALFHIFVSNLCLHSNSLSISF